jgi:HEAT repeat protein
MIYDAASALGELGDAVVVEPLSAVLSNPNEHEGDIMDVNIVTSVVFALRKLNSARAAEPGVTTIARKDEQTRAVIALSLGSFGDTRAVEPLLNSLQADEPLIRSMAACVLGDLGDRRAVDPLLAILADEDFETRNSVVKALGLLGDKRAVLPLLSVLNQSKIAYRRIFVIEALDRLGDLRAIDALIQRLIDPLEDKEVRQAGIEVLGHLGDKRAVPFLLPGLADTDGCAAYEMRWRVAVALGQIGDTQVIETLQAYLSDPEPVMRMAVSGALRQLGVVRAVESLTETGNDYSPDNPCCQA